MNTEVAAPAASRKRRFAQIFAAFALAMGLVFSTSGVANAATYSVSRGYCYDSKAITSNLYFGAGVNYTLPSSHPNITVVLATTYVWGWKRDARGNALPGTVLDQYNVRFLDASGRVLWTEFNSIPNGGKRTYNVGSNVRTIQVIDMAYPYLGGGWVGKPSVAITVN